jgi:prefoldin subunit 5
MITQRNRIGNRPDNRSEPSAAAKRPTRKFPIQRAIQELEEELDAFNDRIAELEGERHNSRAMEVLKENALDFARRIDELRGVLAELTKKHGSP